MDGKQQARRYNNPEDREYPDDLDQIREVLIHENYLSQKDIEICAAVDFRDYENLKMHTNYPGIESLHRTLINNYIDSTS